LPSLDCDGLAVHAEPDDPVDDIALKRFGHGCARKRLRREKLDAVALLVKVE
jgi:hypothetical protein